ncbi:MAG TPA: hypothetical protein VE967_19850 [Gemmatimonadaceae bacterium]|nr:hypothetical protein [Gemmatimonadaceae bacterium]
MTRLARISVLALAVSSIASAQANGFAGTWKLNLAKSEMGGSMYTFSKNASGVWHYSGGGFDTDFDLAGKAYAMPNGISIAGKEVNPTTWDITFTMNGKVVQKMKAAVNGNTLTVVTDVTGADGKSTQTTSTDTRVSGGPGFAGKWKTGNMTGSQTTLKIATTGNAITMEVPEFQSVVKGSFDGKDNPMMQGGQATKMTQAFAKAGATSFTATLKMGGKDFSTDVYTLSADGKTLTLESTTTATHEKTKSVFDRQ